MDDVEKNFNSLSRSDPQVHMCISSIKSISVGILIDIIQICLGIDMLSLVWAVLINILVSVPPWRQINMVSTFGTLIHVDDGTMGNTKCYCHHLESTHVILK